MARDARKCALLTIRLSASLALALFTMKVASPSARLALPCRRAVRFFGGTRPCRARCGMGRALGGGSGFAFEALLQRVHQADDIVRLLLGFGSLDRLAGSLALDQGFERGFIFILE